MWIEMIRFSHVAQFFFFLNCFKLPLIVCGHPDNVGGFFSERASRRSSAWLKHEMMMMMMMMMMMIRGYALCSNIDIYLFTILQYTLQ